MPLQATSGAASYDGFGGGVVAEPNYIESCFSTYLYTGNGSTQTITNNIDLSTKGGLVWIKGRNDATDHSLEDTLRTVSIYAATLSSNTTDAQSAGDITGFTTSGFSLRDYTGATNSSGYNYASWTFRKQPKFFDVVTYTGNGTNGRTVAHSLGSTPGCIIVKRTDASNGWAVYHRSMNASPQDYMMRLNATDAAFTTSPSRWNNTLPTSTEFTLSGNDEVNGSGATYVAYLFAHNAGGFGLTGTDNVISCGTFDANNGEVINLGYEPQWLLYKDASSTSNWRMADTMRGLTNLTGTNAYTIQQLTPNSTAAEAANSGPVLTSTGFTWNQSGGGNKHIYIAIRRGPMKVPTSGTSVFNTVLWTGNQTNNRQITGVGFNPDFVEAGTRSAATTFSRGVVDRLRGTNPFLVTYETGGENANSDLVSFDNDGITVDYISSGIFNNNSNIYGHFFRRAPSFFDEVCYTGNGTNLAINHNLQAVPELIILKYRAGTSYGWKVTATGLTNPNTYYLDLNGTNAESNYTANFIYNRTSTTFTVVSDLAQSGWNWVAYLFATCAGVSKVGSYTGTATTLQVDCGFTGGSRFVLIKRVDDSADWYVWDSARGIVSGNDPYLLLNSTAAEVTNTDYVDTYSAGFEISSTAPAAINANGGTFIFLAIA